MKEIKDLNDLLTHEIQVLYNGEQLLIAGLERMAKKASNSELKTLFQQHLEETRTHIERLKQAAGILNIDADDDGNPSMKGLIAEGEKAIHKDANNEVQDASLICGAQKIEHYEIAGYGTAAYYAEMLGQTQVASLLRQTLEEEQATDTKLNNLAKNKINLRAQHADI